jgi:hypothetical protein
MFYHFAERLVHESSELAVIWEVETALAAVLTEASESGTVMNISELEQQAREVLGSRHLATKTAAQSLQELKFVSHAGAELLMTVLHRLADQKQKHLLKSELKPAKERILSAVGSDTEFAAYLSALMPKTKGES